MTSLDAVLLLLVGLWLLSKGVRILRRGTKTTPLKGPASKSSVFGVSRFLGKHKDTSLVYEEWAEQYGAVFRTPIGLGRTKVILCDPKALQHFYSKETYTYVHNAGNKIVLDNLVGKAILWAEGDSHKRQRKTLTPAFSNAAIRKLGPIFFDSAYKVKEAWDPLLESSDNDGAIIDVQNWMNKVSLDSVGIAGFSHDFGTLQGKRALTAEIFESFSKIKPTLFQIAIYMLGAVSPLLARLPSPARALENQFKSTTEEISRDLLERTRKEKEGAAEGKRDDSVMGLLIKASSDSSEFHMSEEEVIAQIKLLIVAGYETTSIILTWALIELSKDQSFQDNLRQELTSQFGSGGDPTYEQLTNGLPYLDAVVHEVLRMHPPLPVTARVAAEDDIIPLSVPLQTADNKIVDRISIAAGQSVLVPIRTINRSTCFWGADAKEFKPQRWLDEGEITQGRAKEIQGYRHLLTFVDGPRSCLGKGFALTEIKAVLSVLIRNYTFELRDGKDTKFEMGRMLLPRPKVAGDDQCRVPLRVRRVD